MRNGMMLPLLYKEYERYYDTMENLYEPADIYPKERRWSLLAFFRACREHGVQPSNIHQLYLRSYE